MKVNQNVSAVISNAQLHRAENKLTASIERLSSGYKLNKAKDSPAGMAISNKMRAQIKALDQSSRNAADGTSVMQTADGALNETHAMLQRMRELCVQAASDTMTIQDKKACQDEIAALQAEVDRIATDTEFNGRRILDGSQDYRVYPSVDGELASTYIRNFQTSDEVSPANYKFNITTLPEQATTSLEVDVNDATLPWRTEKEGENEVEVAVIKINDSPVKLYKTDTPDDVYKKLQVAGELGGVMVEKDTAANTYKFTTFEYGKNAKISITSDQSVTELGTEKMPATATLEIQPGYAAEVEINGQKVEIDAGDDAPTIAQKLADAGDLADITVVPADPADPANSKYILTTKARGESTKIDATTKTYFVPTAEGVDTQIEMVLDTDQKIDSNGNPVVDAGGNPVPYGEGFADTANYASDGKKVTIRDLNGFEMIFEIDPEMDMKDVLDGVQPDPDPDKATKVGVNLEMTDMGSMTLQIGTHEHQIVDVRIPAVTCESLYIDELNVVRKGGADKAIGALDDAIAQVSAVRSRIGAYQNRLEYAVSSLDATEENMEAAISRIMDTDMAEEMSVYSNMNVLDQAAISVLTQANDMPQQVLQLLQ